MWSQFDGLRVFGDVSKARRVNGVPQTRISKYRSSTDGQWHYVEMWDEVDEEEVYAVAPTNFDY